MPSGSVPAVPDGVLLRVLGHPEEHDPGDARRDAPRRRPSAGCRGCAARRRAWRRSARARRCPPVRRREGSDRPGAAGSRRPCAASPGWSAAAGAARRGRIRTRRQYACRTRTDARDAVHGLPVHPPPADGRAPRRTDGSRPGIGQPAPAGCRKAQPRPRPDATRPAPVPGSGRRPTPPRPGRRSLGRVTGSPASIAAARRRAPNSASASASLCTDGSGDSTSTRSPCSSAVFAVAGPIHAITVTLCGLPGDADEVPHRRRRGEEHRRRSRRP